MTTQQQTTVSLFSPHKNNLTIISSSNNTLKCHNLQTSPPTLQCTLRPRPTPSHIFSHISHATPTLLAARLTPSSSSSSSSSSDASSSHVIYDLTRGVHCHDISLGSQYTLSHVVPCQSRSSSNNTNNNSQKERYFIMATDDATSKLYALEYNATTHALARKIKCGKISKKKKTSLLLTASSPDGNYLFLCKSTECRVLRLSDGSKVSKSEFSDVPRKIYAPLDDLLVVVFDKIVVIYKFVRKEEDDDDDGEWERVECSRWNRSGEDDDDIEAIDVWATKDEEENVQVLSALVNGRILYDVEGKDGRRVTTLATDDKTRRIVAGRFKTNRDALEVLLMEGDDNAADLVAETVTVDGDSDVTYVGRRGTTATVSAEEAAATTTKRRWEEDDEMEKKRWKKQPEIVGYGPNDVEHLATREFVATKVDMKDDDDDDDDDNEPTIAERLRAMEKYADDHHSPPERTSDTTTTTTTTPTTDSLVQLLFQTLRANDDTTLSSSLLHQPLPPTLIENSLTQLLSQTSLEESSLLIERLAERLIYKLGTSPWMSRVLTTWLRCLIVVVVRGRKGGMLARMLPGLRNLVGERMESMKDLMVLEGRLMLIGGSGGGGVE